MPTSRLIIKIVTNIVLACYPFIIFLSLYYGCMNIALLFLSVIFILKLFVLPGLFLQINWFAKILPCLGLFLIIMSWFLRKYELLLYYPVVVNLALLIIFSSSLKYKPTIIERFARMQQPNLPTQAVKYTYKVTLIWCLFFVFNGSIALLTCLLGNLNFWALYNGGISYFLIAALMGGEWLIRKRCQY